MHLLEWVGLVATAVALFGYINYRFIGLPDSIGITAMGLVLSLLAAVFGRYVPGVTEWATGLAERIDMYEVVLHGLLGVLLFAGSLHVNVAELSRHRLAIFVLATVGVLISTVVVGTLMYGLFTMLGIDIALIHCMLFGALISPTDPIAVLDVLKSAGASKTLETKISGESLFNDGTAVVAFLVILGLSTGAADTSVAGVMWLLAKEVAGAAVVGLLLGYGAFLLLKGVDSHPVEIMITIALATAGYSLAARLHVSAPLAVVVMGLVIGNHGAHSAMSEATRQHLFQFWDLIDEILNLVLFGLIGIKLLALAADDVPWVLACLMIPVVLVGRLVSVGAPALVMRPWLQMSRHDVKVMTWGGLRGGISIALALSLPEFAGRDLVVTATYAVVLFSLLIQAPTLTRVIQARVTT